MCGLAGILAPRGAPVDRVLLARMTAALTHRGPDGDGFHVEPGVGLGHRRLSIIDVEGGHQPMFNEDGSVVIVFNGEIYNHAELRPELEAMGHRFATRCDTEAIIHGWEAWGPAVLDRLNGMFTIALWDRNRRQLFLARDRLGKKPLHYARLSGGTLVFASELGALMEAPLPRRVSAAAVDNYFALSYVPDPDTIWEGVRKLPAAHYLLLDADSVRDERPRRYWSPPTRACAMDEEEARPQLMEHLRRATASRLIADVPLGAFLSGGVDSGAVVATAAGLQTSPLATFTIGFPGDEDETPLANQVARRYGTAQHDERAETADYIEAARDQAAIFGEPFGDWSSVPTHAVCQLARKHVTVAVSGDGGDEVFAGYRRYRWHMLAHAVRRAVPAPLRRRVLGGAARLYPRMDWAPRWLRAKHTLTEISLNSALGYYRTVARVHDAQRHALFSPMLLAQLDGHDPSDQFVDMMEAAGGADPLLQAQIVDLQTWLVGDILTKVDRASMANSLEVRAPFLDYKLVEWGLALPKSLKLHRQEGKWILKRALEPLLPREILYRSKQGFTQRLGPQFRQGAARLRGRLLKGPLADSGLFRPETVAKLIAEHEAGRADHGIALWHLLVFEGFLAREAGVVPARTPAGQITIPH